MPSRSVAAHARAPSAASAAAAARVDRGPLDDLVGAPGAGDPRIHAQRFTRNGMTVLPLTRQAGGLQAYKLVVPTSRAHPDPDLQVHENYGWLLALIGELRLVLGASDQVLRAGEAAELDTRAAHWFDRVGDPAELLSFFGPRVSAGMLANAPLRAKGAPR